MALIPGLSFSLKRAVGITKVKQKVAKATGIPMTKQGLERKIGGAIIKKIKDESIEVILAGGTTEGAERLHDL